MHNCFDSHDKSNAESWILFNILWCRGQRKLGSQAQTYIKANTSSCPSASMRSSIIRLKAPPSAAFYPQKKVSRSKASQISIPVPSSMPVSKLIPYNFENSLSCLQLFFIDTFWVMCHLKTNLSKNIQRCFTFLGPILTV